MKLMPLQCLSFTATRSAQAFAVCTATVFQWYWV